MIGASNVFLFCGGSQERLIGHWRGRGYRQSFPGHPLSAPLPTLVSLQSPSRLTKTHSERDTVNLAQTACRGCAVSPVRTNAIVMKMTHSLTPWGRRSATAFACYDPLWLNTGGGNQPRRTKSVRIRPSPARGHALAPAFLSPPRDCHPPFAYSNARHLLMFAFDPFCLRLVLSQPRFARTHKDAARECTVMWVGRFSCYADEVKLGREVHYGSVFAQLSLGPVGIRGWGWGLGAWGLWGGGTESMILE